MALPHQDDSLGIYISVPFCKAKCTFCNFASGVFAGQRIDTYLDRVILEMRQAREWAERLGASLPSRVDTVYFGGGTPSLLNSSQIVKIFGALHELFNVEQSAEVTVEAAPGQLARETLDALLRAGANRLSFGVQSFVDQECAAVARLHTGAECVAELKRVTEAGFRRVGIDLIAGLPGQTRESWRRSIDQAIACGVEHVSLYMLEIDEASRLGREFLGGGARYGADALPADDAVAENYALGSEWLEAAGIPQYEISNFARPGGESQHNRRYWERHPYLGFGLDAHSMLLARGGDAAVRWANPDEMSVYLGQGLDEARTVDHVDRRAALEETLFLGLRLIEGVSLAELELRYRADELEPVREAAADLIEAGLIARSAERLCLTARGRMVSNEVFSRLLLEPVA